MAAGPGSLSRFVVDFADPTVAIAIWAAIALTLAYRRWNRGLLAWLTLVPGGLLTVAVLKTLFFAHCGLAIAMNVRNPSGHAAAALSVYGGALTLLLRNRLKWPYLLSIQVLIAGVFGITMVLLHSHSLAEIGLGTGIGISVAWALTTLAGPPPQTLAVAPTLAGGLLCAVIAHGSILQAEIIIHKVSVIITNGREQRFGSLRDGRF